MNSAGSTAGDPDTTRGANRHRPEDASDAAPADASPHGRGALIALGVAAIGTVAFVVGLRAALHHMPPERSGAAAADSARHGPAAQPDEYPRLR